MRQAQRSVAVLLLLTVAMMLGALPASAEQYELTLDRKRPVGSKFNVAMQGEQTSRQVQTVDGKRSGSESKTIAGKIEGLVEVLEVHDTKETKKVAVKINAFEGARNDVAFEIDLNKRIIAAAVEGEMTLTYEDGSELPEQAVELFDLLFGFMIEDSPSEVSDNQMFRLQQPRSPGDEWACDNELIAKDMSNTGELTLDPKSVDGKFKFIELTKLNDQSAAQIDVTIKLNAIGIPGLTKQGVKIVSSGGELSMAGKLPLDPKSLDGAMTMKMAMSFEAGLEANGSVIGIFNNINATVQTSFEQVK